jgi:hypothetical protein
MGLGVEEIASSVILEDSHTLSSYRVKCRNPYLSVPSRAWPRAVLRFHPPARWINMCAGSALNLILTVRSVAFRTAEFDTALNIRVFVATDMLQLQASREGSTRSDERLEAQGQFGDLCDTRLGDFGHPLQHSATERSFGRPCWIMKCASSEGGGMSQEDLALVVGLDRTYISQVERGKWNVTCHNRARSYGSDRRFVAAFLPMAATSR